MAPGPQTGQDIRKYEFPYSGGGGLGLQYPLPIEDTGIDSIVSLNLFS